MSIRTFIGAAVVAGAALVGASQASAMPVGPAPAAGIAVENVAFGCGPGFHPNRWGRCVPNRGPVMVRPWRRPPPRMWGGRPHRPHRW
jgi:hypothetical protein